MIKDYKSSKNHLKNKQMLQEKKTFTSHPQHSQGEKKDYKTQK